jgi:hypothetical protein
LKGGIFFNIIVIGYDIRIEDKHSGGRVEVLERMSFPQLSYMYVSQLSTGRHFAYICVNMNKNEERVPTVLMNHSYHE